MIKYTPYKKVDVISEKEAMTGYVQENFISRIMIKMNNYLI